MGTNKKVSIISPCYNGEKYLHIFLDSIINQTYKNIELILINDGSTDNSLNVIKEYIRKFENQNMKLIVLNQENKGQAAAVNLGLKHFTGECMMWMDSDDYLMPNAIQKKVCNLENNPDVDFNLCKGFVVNENDLDNPISTIFRKKTNPDNLFYDLIVERNVVFCPGTIFVRSKALKKVIPNLNIYESREGQNWQLMLPLAYSLKYDYIDDVLFKYVVHNNSHSHVSRTYSEQIQRRDNFVALIGKTIDNINEMNNEEKEKWKNISYLHNLHAKLKLAIVYDEKKDYNKIKQELKNKKFKLTFKDNYTLYRLSRDIKHLIKKD